MQYEYIQVAHADNLHERAMDANAIILIFSRREVEEGLTGDVLSRLYTLSDSTYFVQKFKDSVSFRFEGYDDDERELFEIDECRRFMRAVNAQWCFWYHFLEKRHDSFSVLFRLLCDTEVIRLPEGKLGFRFESVEQSRSTALSLFVGLNALYDAHGIGMQENKVMTMSVITAFNKIVGL